jgi:hypothetical protein
VWPKMNEAGYKMDKKVLHNILYISSTFSFPDMNRRSSRGLPSRWKSHPGGSLFDFLDDKTNDHTFELGEIESTTDDSSDSGTDNDRVDIASDVAKFHDILYEATEQTTSIRVRRLVSEGKTVEAEKILDESTVCTHER